MTSEDCLPQRYVPVESQGYAGHPPPYGYKPHKAPRYPRSHRGSSGCGCLRLCCCFFGCCRCCLCTILIIIILLVAIVVTLYYLLKPNIPSYDIESINVNSFEMRKENKVYSDVVVVVKAENPNEDIGLDYLENEIRILYSRSQLCSGKMPPFLQPGKNTTNVNVELKGESEFGPETESRFMEDQKNGNIPLLITVRLPIRLVLHDLIHLSKFVVNVNCSLVIDKIQPNQRPKILEKDFTYGIEL